MRRISHILPRSHQRPPRVPGVLAPVSSQAQHRRISLVKSPYIRWAENGNLPGTTRRDSLLRLPA